MHYTLLMDNANLMLPTIHTNGTGRDTLLDVHTVAAGAVRRAIDCLSDTSPNGRDFYPQGIDAWKRARREHESRLERLQSVLKELQFIAEAVADAAGR